jgi:hypothetical protein
MREELGGNESLVVFLCGEPLAWLILGVGAAIGYVAEAITFIFFAFGVLLPMGAAWLYRSRLRRASYLCSSCGHFSSYAQARASARSP